MLAAYLIVPFGSDHLKRKCAGTLLRGSMSTGCKESLYYKESETDKMANGYSTTVWISVLVVIALSLAACMPVTPESAVTPAPTEEVTEEVAEEATEEATEEPTEEATAEAASEDGDMGALVRQILAQELQLDLDQIEIVSVEAVEWPDACLGVYTADTMCAQVITPGYRVVLAADGEQYEYHTNADGSFVQLFAEPEANVGDIALS